MDRLRDWEYLERQIHRLMCAWGRFFSRWEDITVMHHHIWSQAECIRKLRDRLTQFPGGKKNLDQPVSNRLEALVNHVLCAPTQSDAIEGIYSLLNGAMLKSYADYAIAAHPVHDAPTLDLLNDIMTQKEQYRLWLRELRRRYPAYTGDQAYLEKFESILIDLDHLTLPLTPTDPPAKPVGLDAKTTFQMPRFAGRPAGSEPKADFRPFMFADFQTDVEARRLFWCSGYANEMNLAMDQLRWIYETPYMAWDFHYDVSRHMWDESRHGDSGRSRLLDFGIDLSEIGYLSYDPEDPYTDRFSLLPQLEDDQPDAMPASGVAEPLTPSQVYDEVFYIGMIAENGHFQVKREAYEDFKAGGDMESAEMMLFDIVDEHSHVQYAHRWLPVLAEYDDRAIEIVEGCREAGLQVPEEVAVLGVDNDEMRCEFAPVPISSVDDDQRSQGYEAGRLLDQLMQGKQPPDRTLIKPRQVVTRVSTDILAIDHPKVAAALKLIWNHFREPLTAGDISDAIPMSGRRLHDAFLKHVGRTISQEIKRRRIQHAKSLLAEDPSAKLEAVATQSGFSSGDRMTKTFVAITGETPSAYRKRIQVS
jgi:AraC-like DNA-binding protein